MEHNEASAEEDRFSREQGRIKFRNYAEGTPELKALLRHLSTVPCEEERNRLLSDWRKEISLRSFPLDIPLDEAEWYVDNVLPKSKPKPAELFVHQFGLKNYRLALFSYINPKSGCLSRHRFCVIYQPEKKSVDYDRVVNSYKTGIINYGGFATVELVPEVRWNAINVMMGDPKPSWTQYHVNLYSFRLVKDASQSHTFDYTDIDRYKLSLKPPSRVNINYLSQLV